MPGRARHIVGGATIVILLACAAPAVALANGGGSKCKASACQVYTEPLPTAGGKQPSDTGGTKATKPVPISKKATKTLRRAGKEQKLLKKIVTNPAYGASRGLESTAATSSVVAPSALGAAFDLGAGPTALLALLIATAAGLGIFKGVGSWRRRRAGA